jgi:uncharacterized Zn finger protein
MTDSIDTLKTNREWWVQQWLDLLDKYRFKKRLERGRNYARQGNVLSIEFRSLKVIARVQGSETQPYKISLWLDTFTDDDWNFVFDTLSERAIFSAKLLAGEMPTNIEDIFAANGLRLFPFSLPEIASRCSCPDKANPCKHVIAVYHLLGDRFADDPFLLFQLRGRSKHEAIAALRSRRGSTTTDETTIESGVSEASPPVPLDLSSFWTYDQPLDPSLIAIVPSSENAVLDVLGTMPLASGRHTIRPTDIAALEAFLKQVYATARDRAVIAAMQLDDDSPA